MPEDLPIRVDDVPAHRREYGEVGATRRRLGVATGARRLGIALIEIDPGRRATPPHSHADEDEAFLVLAGSGLSYQTSGPDDVRTYAVGVDDLLWHPANADAHTLIAGADGLTVLAVGEGSRTHITYLPRTNQFWLGPRWSPADGADPHAADADLGPLALPEPTAARPPTIRNLAELPLEEGREGRLAYATRGIHDMGADRLVLAQDAMPPGTHTTDLHFHSAREEAWYVRSGSGIARLGGDAHPLSAGSFWLCRENTGVGHRIEVGPDGMQLVTMGDLIPGDVCVYPEKRTFRPARGLELPYRATADPDAMTTRTDPPEGYAIVDPDEVDDAYAGSDVPGEFRRLTEALGAAQLAVTLIRVPAHSDFEQGTGHYHDEVEELYLVTRGTLTMRFGDAVRTVSAPAAVRVDSQTPRSHRNEGSEPVEMWAISRRIDRQDATKIDDFWEASRDATQHRGPHDVG